MEAVWQELEAKLSSLEPEVAKEVVARAREASPSRRAKEVFRAQNRRVATPLEEPLLRVATVLVEEKLVGSYEEAFGVLGVEADRGQAGLQGEATGEAPSAQKAPAPEAHPVQAAPAREASPPPPNGTGKPPRPQDQNEAAQDSRWRRAYQEVFGQDPSEDPLLYRERLAQALLFYRQEHGRRRASRRFGRWSGGSRSPGAGPGSFWLGAAGGRGGGLCPAWEALRPAGRDGPAGRAPGGSGAEGGLQVRWGERRSSAPPPGDPGPEGPGRGPKGGGRRGLEAGGGGGANGQGRNHPGGGGAHPGSHGPLAGRGGAEAQGPGGVGQAHHRSLPAHLEAKERRRGLFGLFGGEK